MTIQAPTQKIAYILTMLGAVLLLFTGAIYGYNAYSTALSVHLPDQAKTGTILSKDPRTNVYRLSNIAFDSEMAGVVVDTADIIIEREGQTGEANGLLMENGEGYILVSGSAGAISKGDIITSSEQAGVGVKTVDGGIAVATALEDFRPQEENDVQLIRAMIEVRYVTGNTGVFSSMARTYQDLVNYGPSQLAGTSTMFRFVLGAFIVILAFLAGFFMFGRIALRGVEALGRNPLARRTILLGILLNAFLTILLVLLAIFLAYVIISA